MFLVFSFWFRVHGFDLNSTLMTRMRLINKDFFEAVHLDVFLNQRSSVSTVSSVFHSFFPFSAFRSTIRLTKTIEHGHYINEWDHPQHRKPHIHHPRVTGNA
jgi:hypothetical protein